MLLSHLGDYLIETDIESLMLVIVVLIDVELP